MQNYTVNALLCFLSTQSDKLDRADHASILVDFYTKDELTIAKNLLISECDKVNLSNHISDFKKSRIRPNVEQKLVKDILDIWAVIDTNKGGILETTFVAADPNRFPSVNAEKFNLKFLISSILKLQEASVQQDLILGTISESVSAIHHKIDLTSISSPDLPQSLQSTSTSGSDINISADQSRKRKLDSSVAPFVPSKQQKCDKSTDTVNKVNIVTFTPNIVSNDDHSSGTVFYNAQSNNDASSGVVSRNAVASGAVSRDAVSPGAIPPHSDADSSRSDADSPRSDANSCSDAGSRSDADTRSDAGSRSDADSRSDAGSRSGAGSVFDAASLNNALSRNTEVDAEEIEVGEDTVVSTEIPVHNNADIDANLRETAVAAAAAVAESSRPFTEAPATPRSNPAVKAAAASAKKAAAAAKAANKAALAAKAVAQGKEEAAEKRKAEAKEAAARVKAVKESIVSNPITQPKTPTPSTTPSPSPSSSTWLIQARKNKKISSVVGKRQGGILEGVAPLTRDYVEVFISRLSESSTIDKVKRHLHDHGIEVKDVYLLNSKRKGTKSAKVRVALEHRDKVKDENVWPLHCRVQDWVPSSKRGSEKTIA